MSLQLFKAPLDVLKQHAETCDEPLCQICIALWEREYEADRLKKIEEEREQDCEFNALVEAERNGDEPWDFDPNDETYPSRA